MIQEKGLTATAKDVKIFNKTDVAFISAEQIFHRVNDGIGLNDLFVEKSVYEKVMEDNLKINHSLALAVQQKDEEIKMVKDTCNSLIDDYNKAQSKIRSFDARVQKLKEYLKHDWSFDKVEIEVIDSIMKKGE